MQYTFPWDLYLICFYFNPQQYGCYTYDDWFIKWERLYQNSHYYRVRVWKNRTACKLHLFLSYVKNKIIERHSVNMVLQATLFFFAVQGTCWLDWYEIPDKTVLLTPDISQSKFNAGLLWGKNQSAHHGVGKGKQNNSTNALHWVQMLSIHWPRCIVKVPALVMCWSCDGDILVLCQLCVFKTY